jgi:hypothetical protein
MIMEEIKYPIGGFAPGNYSCNCVNCKHDFDGDKMAFRCEPCSNQTVDVLDDYLPGFINQFGDGPLGELNPEQWDALEFLRWLKLNNYKIIKNVR